MTPALLIMLAWAAAQVLSPAAVILHLVRHGTRRLWLAFLCPLGAFLAFGLDSAAIAQAESSWSLAPRGLHFAAAVGVLGIALQVIGWRAVLRRRPGPGACRACGYDLHGMDRCPECGKPTVLGPSPVSMLSYARRIPRERSSSRQAATLSSTLMVAGVRTRSGFPGAS